MTVDDRVNELITAQLEDDRVFADNDEHYWAPPPSSILRVRELGHAALPALIRTIEQAPPDRVQWAIYAVRSLAPLPPETIELLASYAELDAALARLLYDVDPARATTLDLHRSAHCWEHAYRAIAEHGPEAEAKHVALLLEDPHHPIVRHVLRPYHWSHAVQAPVVGLAEKAPELVPIDCVRGLARHADLDVQRGAIAVLATLHQPEDAELVLGFEATHPGSELWHELPWLAPLPGSERLISRLQPRGLYQLAIRRRCAGLSLEPVRDAARALMEQRELDEWPARLAGELGDRELATAVAARVPRDVVFWRPADVCVRVFAMLGVVDTASAELTRRVQTWQRAPWMSLATADERYARGALEDTLLVDDSAYAMYALVLQFEPRCAYAAAQLAWIDRAYGTPITRERTMWLRELGVGEDLLDELAIPVTPIPGIRSTDRFAPSSAKGVLVAQAAEHLARVRRATSSA